MLANFFRIVGFVQCKKTKRGAAVAIVRLPLPHFIITRGATRRDNWQCDFGYRWCLRSCRGVKLTIVVRHNFLPSNGKLALVGQTRNCMVVLGSMLFLTWVYACHLDDLCYFIKVTDTEISHNRGDFRFTNYKRKIAAQWICVALC